MNVQLNYRTYGTGFPLIILHGLFGSLENWQTVSRRLGEHFQVFAIDQRNHGGSPHSQNFNYEVMAGDLLEFMKTHGLARAHILGHSMGGKTAMQFALRHPEKVGKLIVVDMAPKAYPPGHLDIFKALFALDLTRFQNRKEMEDALADSIPEVSVRQFLLKNVMRDEAGVFKWKLGLDEIHQNYDQLNQALAKEAPFPGEALFIKGGRSDYILAPDEGVIKEYFPRALITSIPDAGHWVHAEKLEEFVKIALEFLLQR
jgi:esterase